MTRASRPESFLPLSSPVLSILLALGGGPLHPYGLMQEIDRRTGGKAVILPGSLYTSIARMLKHGLIEEASGRPDPRLDDQRRRYYQISTLGRQVAAAEIERMKALIEVAHAHNLSEGVASGSESGGG